jgi:anti-sigma regulatory factor (Ser/Thr protein kinase)
MAARGEAEQQQLTVSGGATGALPDTVRPDEWLELWPGVLTDAVVTTEELHQALVGLLTDPQTDEVRLPAEPDASARARRLTRSVLASWGLNGLGEVAEQLVSELVANVVRHTGGRSFGLRVARRQGGVRFEVRDPSRALPCLIMGDPEDESGRGLQLVNLLADRWGADLMSRGKSVWFELRGVPARTE